MLAIDSQNNKTNGLIPLIPNPCNNAFLFFGRGTTLSGSGRGTFLTIKLIQKPSKKSPPTSPRYLSALGI
jgi:hypothetical protein